VGGYVERGPDGDDDEHHRAESQPGRDLRCPCQAIELLGTEQVRPVVLAADQLEPLMRRVRDIGGDIGAVARRPGEADRYGEAVTAGDEVGGYRERHEDLGRGSAERGDEVAGWNHVEDQVPEFVKAEIGPADQRHPHAAHDREPTDECTPRQRRGDRADRLAMRTREAVDRQCATARLGRDVVVE